jgi:hypothetical protein
LSDIFRRQLLLTEVNGTFAAMSDQMDGLNILASSQMLRDLLDTVGSTVNQNNLAIGIDCVVQGFKIFDTSVNEDDRSDIPNFGCLSKVNGGRIGPIVRRRGVWRARRNLGLNVASQHQTGFQGTKTPSFCHVLSRSEAK